MKFDNDKPPIHLIPADILCDIANVFKMGAEKYGVNNWRDDADTTSWSRTYSSLQRHLIAWQTGEDTDPESGLPHLAHATTQLMILMVQAKYHDKEMDDRYKVEKAEVNEDYYNI